MSLLGKTIKGAAVLSIGEGVGYGASFARNIILARMLTKADFGIAATFALIISMFELCGKMATHQLVVQSRHGAEPDFLGTAHWFQFLVSLLSAGAMLALSGVLASFFGIPNTRWAFFILPALFLLKGLENLDVRRMHREMRFLPSVLVEVVPQVVVLVAAWPLAAWLQDYRAILWIVILKGVLTCLGTHYYAENRYRWHFGREHLRSILQFGWPLLLNGFLMFAIFQGDRFLVGRYYSMADLGAYAVAASLTVVPGQMFAQVLVSTMLPIMSRVQDSPIEFQHRYTLCIQMVAVFAAAYALFLITAGESLVILLFGQKYAGTGIVMAWLAAANAFRLLRMAPAIGSLATADSKNQMYSNFLRATALVVGAWAALNGKPLWLFAACALLGELVSFTGTFLRFSLVNRIALRHSVLPSLVLPVALFIAGSAVHFGVYTLNSFMALSVSLFASCLAGVAGIGLNPLVRQYSLEAFSRVRNRYLRAFTPSP